MRGRGFGPGRFGRPMGRPLMRPGLRPGLGPGLGRPGLFRPFLGWRPIPLGMFTLLAFAETGLMYKLHRDEIARIEEYRGKPVAEMSKEELTEAMEALNIHEQPISNADREAAQTVQTNHTTLDDLKLLDKLTQMYYAGTLTEEEYTQKRKQILGL